jgi:predicted cupin superfamily sugar epimerase
VAGRTAARHGLCDRAPGRRHGAGVLPPAGTLRPTDHIIDTGGRHECRLLTRALEDGEPAGVVPADALQAARLAPGARWTLCGCTVAPGFEFEDFEMPPRTALIAEHPEHAAVIEALTR